MSILNKEQVLVVNALYQPIDVFSIRDAITSANSTQNGEEYAGKLIKFDYEQNSIGGWDLSTTDWRPVTFDEWMGLPVRDIDLAISTPRQKIRAPTVIMVRYEKVPKKKWKPTIANLRKRDGDRCQYSGRKLTRKEISIDHIISKDEWKRRGLLGSPDNWKNVVICAKEINFKKGNKTLKEAGLKLIRQPFEPLPIPVSFTITDIRHRDWTWFIK